MNVPYPDQMKKFQEAFDKYLDAYMNKRDLSLLKEMLTEDFCGCGTGLDETFYDMQAGLRIFHRDIASAPDTLRCKIHKQDIKILDRYNALAVCELDLETNILNQKLRLNNLRMMMALHEEKGIVKIAGMHISFPSQAHDEDESYPLKELEERNELLNRRVQEQTRELSEKQKQLEMFFSQSIDGFFFMMLDKPVAWDDSVNKQEVVDYVLTHQRITKVNQAMLDQYGATEENFLGLTSADLFAHDPEHGRQIIKGLLDKGRWHVETRERRMDGTPIIIDGDYICLYDEQGRFTGHFGVQKDITKRKQAEQEIRNINQQLQRANSDKDKLFSIIAHDLKSPLSSLLSATEMLADQTEKFSEKEIRLLSTELHKNVKNTFALLEDLLQWARMSQGGIDYAPKPCRVSELVRTGLSTVQNMAGRKEVTIRREIPQDLTVLVDQPMINTVIRNILFNAVKFSHRNSEIVVTARQEARTVTIAVQDHGKGMDEEVLTSVFAMEREKQQLGTENEKGSGLGLVLCRQFIEHHGGEIRLESEPGQGTTVYFTLPAGS
ncbi:MAG: ATP-binding protein [Desulfosalsimonas sp.]